MERPIAYIINEGVAEAVECEIIKEDNNFVIAEGILQQAGKINRNRRFYTEEDLYKEIYGPRLRELVTTGNLKGEAGHPTDMTLARQQKVDPRFEQVWYTKLWMENGYVKAHFRGTNNELGKSFDADLKDGQRPSFSLRSLGTITNENGQNRVCNLHIITYDRVYYPSYDNAYTEKILTESADYDIPMSEYLKNNGNKLCVDEGFESIAPILNTDIVDLLMKESSDLNSLCESFNPRNVSMSKDGKSVNIVTENYDTIIMPTNDYIDNAISDYCTKHF